MMLFKRIRFVALSYIVGVMGLAAGSAWSNPVGPTVVNGNVSFAKPNASTLNITTSPGAIINWKQFSIGTGETTLFVQPSAASAVLNRVVGSDASQILGQLQSNGRVFLINPNGIVIGNGARIDTNSFIASTLDMADADFLAGKLKFFATPASGSISNQGVITAGPGGGIALIAPNIENSGIIQAPDGKLLLAAGRKLEIASMDLDGVTFEIQAPSDSVLNLGQLLADNGIVQVFAGTLRQSGEIRANRLVEDGDGSVRLVASGDITLTSDSTSRADGLSGGSLTIQSTNGVTYIAGELSARGSNGKGGDIELLGNRVAVESGAQVDVSGSTGGGQILVGGDYQGSNAAIQNADRVFVGEHASLRADATDNGNGGRIIIWSNENTRYLGDLSARGGPNGGNGGFAEVSGKINLEFAGGADLTSTSGTNGSLLLDPLDIIVATTGGILTTLVDQFADFPGNIITISPTALNAVGGNVILQANRDIYFNDAVSLTTAGAGLSATAGGASFNAGQIYLTQGISTNGGAVTLKAFGISGSGGIGTAGGAVNLQTSGTLSYSGAVNAGSGSITATGQNGVFSGNYTSTGTVTLNTPAGGISGNTISGGIVDLIAYSSIYSAGVNATTRIDANSLHSYVQLYNFASQPLRLGTINGNTGVYLYSNAGIQQASGGSITSPYVQISGQNNTATLGSISAPLVIATPQLALIQMAGPAKVVLSGSPTLSLLNLQGTLAALGATSITGAANLSTFSLSPGVGVLNANIVATGGFSSGLTLNVSDAGINIPTLTVPGAAVNLYARGGVTIGTANTGSLYVTATDAITTTSATTSNGGITLYSGSCTYYDNACTHASPISAGSLTTGGGGDINLASSDNGNINVGTLSSAGSVNISAASFAYSSTNPRTSAITIGLSSASNDFNITNYGTGDITASSNITSGDSSSFSSTHGALALQSVTSNFGVTGNATGNISFQSISNATSGAVSLASTQGYIRALTDNTTADINNVGDVSLVANDATNGGIGNTSFAHPMDIVAGPASTVTLSAGKNIGAAGKPVTVDTSGVISAASIGGQFHVSAQDMSAIAKTVTGITLSASAAGMGNGGTSVFSSQDLSVNATSNGSTITLGDIVQSANTLDKFSFNATGSSGLTFGNVDLTTAGYNQLLLASSGALTQTLPVATNNINAGYIELSAASSGTVTVGNVTSSTAGANSVGNSINISGGNITAGNLNAPSISLSGANLILGSVSSSGTHRGYYTGYDYVPRLGYYQYLTDELHLTASGSLSTTGNIDSQTSAFVNAGNGITVAGGIGSITGGHTTACCTYYDTVTAAAGSGTLDTGAISGYYVNASGNTLNTGDITADIDLHVSGTSFTTGNLAAGSSDTLTLTATAGYTSGAIALSAGTLNVQATTGGINLTGATVTAPNVALNAPGIILATLTNTTGLNVTAGNSFTIASTAALGAVYVTAKGNQLGSSSITGTGQTLNYTATGNTVALALTSPSSLQARYTEASSTVTGIDVAASIGGGSLLYVSGLNANLTTSSVLLANGSATLTTAGNIGLTSLTTGGGAVSATSTAGDVTLTSVTSGGGAVGVYAANDVNVESVTTLGNNVTLTANTGNIVKTGTQTLQIDTINNVSAPSGTVTLSASNGSIGSVAARLQVGNAVTLDATAKNEIAVDVTNPLTNLYLTTNASGSGVLSVTNSNYAGFSLTRSGSDLALGPVTPGTIGSFALTARDGNIKVNGDISNVANLTLNAGNGYNSTGDLTVQASGGPRSVTATGTLDWRAGHNLLIAAGAASGENVTVQGATTTLVAGNDLSILANGGAALFNQTSGLTQTLQAGHDFRVVGGSNGISGASAALVSAGYQSFNVGNDLLIQAGSADNASATVQATYYQQLNNYANNLSILGGAGAGASATLQGYYQSFGTLRGSASVVGGSGSNAFAEMVATTSSQYLGNEYIYYADATDSVLVQGGSGSGAYASVRAAGTQNIYSGGNIQVLGGMGAGANAEIFSSGGGQNIGSTSTYFYDPTLNIFVQAGSGGTARIQAAGSQSVLAGGDITVIGGSGANMTASIESSGGSQTIGNTYIYYNDPTNNILVQGGTASGSAAWIKAATGQTVDAGQNITLTAGTTDAYAEMSTASGSQSIGNLGPYYDDQTNAISLSGGTGNNAYAKISTGGSQTVSSAAGITLAGGTGDNAGAMMLATSGQTVTTTGSLALTGGTATTLATSQTAIRNATSGAQSVTATGAINVTGGGYGSDTWIRQDSTSTQLITGDSLAIVATAAGGPNSTTGVISGGAQNVALHGGAGNATLTVANYSAASGTSARLYAAGNQSIVMPFALAGRMQVGDTTALGQSLVYAGGTQNLIVGDLLVQGGASAAASSKLQVVGDMTVNSLAGPIQVLGGIAGPASIDPIFLNIISNTGVTVQGGGSPTATATILAGNINIGATNGNVLVTGGSASGAFAGITANGTPGFLNIYGSGNLLITPNAGGSSLTALGTSNIVLNGFCTGCSIGLFGPFNLSFGSIASTLLFSTSSAIDQLTADLLALLDSLGLTLEYDLFASADGEDPLYKKQPHQCS